MRKHVHWLAVAAVVGMPFGSAGAASLQTFVSGDGTDAGACPKTAPCATFAYAHNQTMAGGEITVLTSGPFGPVIISKALSIVAEGSDGSIIDASDNPTITINAGANDIVHLRGLIVEGTGRSLGGIRFNSGGTLHIQKCVVRNFKFTAGSSGYGLAFSPSGASELYIVDSTFADNGLTASDGGIIIKPGAAGRVTGVLDRVHATNNTGDGIRLDGTDATGASLITVRNSAAAGNSVDGISANGTKGTMTIMVEQSAATGNKVGMRADGRKATVLMSGATVVGNGTGLLAGHSGTITSFGTNNVSANTTDGAPTSTIPQL